MLTKNRKDWVKEYRRFVAIESDDEIAGVLERKKWPSVMGPEIFSDWVKGKYYRFSDIKFHKARGRKPSKSYIVIRRRGFRPITQ